MSVKIRLKRLGKIRQPQYRVVVMDSRTKRNGRAIEEVGTYHPKEEPSFIEIDSERVQYWLGVGAQPTEAVAALLRVTGDWQKFKGEPGAEGTLKQPAAKPDKKALYEAALKAAQGDDAPAGGAKKAEKKTEKKAEPKAEEPKAEPDVSTQEPQVDEAQAAVEEQAAPAEGASEDKA